MTKGFARDSVSDKTLQLFLPVCGVCVEFGVSDRKSDRTSGHNKKNRLGSEFLSATRSRAAVHCFFPRRAGCLPCLVCRHRAWRAAQAAAAERKAGNCGFQLGKQDENGNLSCGIGIWHLGRHFTSLSSVNDLMIERWCDLSSPFNTQRLAPYTTSEEEELLILSSTRPL